jgi:hypothetical protein
MNELMEKVLSLSREEAIEAVLVLKEKLAIDESRGAELIETWTASPYQHIADIEDLARVTLLAYAADEKNALVVVEIVNGVGRKNFVFGGAEIVAVGAIALAALHIVLSDGKTAQKRTVKVTRDGDKETVEITDDVKYGISGVVSRLIEIVSGRVSS